MNSPDPNDELETRVDAELKQLPPLAAPSTLAPQVLAALRARAARPWWRRVWWEWPATAKAASVVIALALAWAFSSGSAWIDDGVTQFSARFSEQFTPGDGLGETLATLAGALGLLYNQAGQSLLLSAFLLAGGLYLLCIGLGTLFVRSTLRRA